MYNLADDIFEEAVQNINETNKEMLQKQDEKE